MLLDPRLLTLSVTNEVERDVELTDEIDESVRRDPRDGADRSVAFPLSECRQDDSSPPGSDLAIRGCRQERGSDAGAACCTPRPVSSSPPPSHSSTYSPAVDTSLLDRTQGLVGSLPRAALGTVAPVFVSTFAPREEQHASTSSASPTPTGYRC